MVVVIKIPVTFHGHCIWRTIEVSTCPVITPTFVTLQTTHIRVFTSHDATHIPPVQIVLLNRISGLRTPILCLFIGRLRSPKRLDLAKSDTITDEDRLIAEPAGSCVSLNSRISRPASRCRLVSHQSVVRDANPRILIFSGLEFITGCRLLVEAVIIFATLHCAMVVAHCVDEIDGGDLHKPISFCLARVAAIIRGSHVRAMRP